MKKMILTALVAVVVTGATSEAGAQKRFGRGDWFLGVDSSIHDWRLGGVDGGEASSTWIDLNAMGGWFVADRVAVDVLAGAKFAKARGGRGDAAFNFGAGVRYYPLAGLFGRVGYNGSAADGSLVSDLDARVGYDLFVSRRLFIEPAVYFRQGLDRGGASVLGLSLGVGLKF